MSRNVSCRKLRDRGKGWFTAETRRISGIKDQGPSIPNVDTDV